VGLLDVFTGMANGPRGPTWGAGFIGAIVGAVVVLFVWTEPPPRAAG
jgi:uncharacterized membrane protein YeaQ/YmgE (transglycosylase-associated protein family)